MPVDNTAQMRELDPSELSNCKVLITVPHMDDAVLACGGTILKLANKNQIHLVYCTDGKGILNNPKKAASMVSGEERIGDVRQEETRNALSLSDFGAGLVKAVVYGSLVAFSGCLRGMQCGRSASAVGAATTSAVVTSIVLIVIASGIINVIDHIIG